MANSQKFTLTFDAQLNVNQMKGALSSIQSELSKLKLPANINQGFQDTLTKLSNEIKNFENLTNKSSFTGADFKQVEKSATRISGLFSNLQSQVKTLGSLSDKELQKLFPADAVNKIQAGEKALNSYESTIDQLNSKLITANERLKALQNKLQVRIQNRDTAQANVDNLTNNAQSINDLAKAEGIKQEIQTYKELEAALNSARQAKANYDQAVANGDRKANSITEAGLNKTISRLEAVKQAYDDQTNAIKTAQQVLTAAKGQVTRTYNDIAEAQLNLTQTQKEAFAGSAAAIQQLFQDLNNAGFDTSKYKADIDGAKQAINEYVDVIRSQLLSAIQGVDNALNSNGQAYEDNRRKVEENALANQKLEERMRDVSALKSRIQYFFGLSNAVNLIKRAIRGAVDTIKELDKAMTATAVVTDFNVGDMWKQLPEYTKRANELGVTTQAAYEAATLYYQQGLNSNEVNALSVETLKMARIAGLDAAEATDRMTNALRGFNMEITEGNAQRVDDVYSELAANTASNVDEISTAMTKVASLAHNANMEFETTAAFLAQIIETTRESAETAGTALKTVVARFSEVKKLVDEGELTGTDEEGQAIDVNKVGVALRSAGIDLNKYFLGEVGLDDIFMELASKWDSLTSLQQRYIATQAAGSRQQSRFIALMSDYARTQELVNKAYNAQGASARQFEKTQESLESKLARLKNAWNEFLMGLTNNQMVKSFVDSLTNLLNWINKITSAFGDSTNSVLKWGVAITAISTGKALFRNRGLLDGILGMFVGGTGAKTGGGLLKNIAQSRAGRAAAFAQIGTGSAEAWNGIGALGQLGIKIGNSSKIAQVLSKTKLISGLGSLLGFGAGGAGAAAGTTASATAAAGLATALLAVAAAATAALVAYKAWYKFSPEGQLKQATKYAENMEQVAKTAATTASEIKNVQNQYEAYTKSLESANTAEEREQAILSRNEYITKLLQEDSRYAQYIESVINEEGQFVLVFKEGELEKITQAAEIGAKNAQAGADFAQASQSGKAANVTYDKAEEYLRSRGIYYKQDETGKPTFYRRQYDYEMDLTGNELIEVFDEIKLTGNELNEVSEKYFFLREMAAQKEAESANTALQAYQELISTLQQTEDIKFDESLKGAGDILAKSLADDFNAQEYFKILREKISEIKDFGDKELLQEAYYNRFHTFADQEWDKDQLAQAIAEDWIREAQGNVAEQRAQQLKDFTTSGTKEEQATAKALLQALTGSTEFTSVEDVEKLLSENNKRQIEKLAKILDWDPSTLAKNIIQAQEKARIQRQSASATYYEQLLRAGINPEAEKGNKEGSNLAQDFYHEKDLELVQLRADTASEFGNLGPLEEYQEELKQIATLQKEDLQQIQNFASNFDLSNPIKAFQQLQQAEKKAGEGTPLQTLIIKVREVNKELLTTPSLLRALENTENFDKLSDSLADIVKENGKITPKALQELAKTSTELQAVIDSAQGKFQGLAEALTLVAQGKIGINQVNDALIVALNTGTDFKQILADIQEWITNFNKGTDSKEGIEHFKEGLKELGELAENWEFGNDITENLYNHLFGEGEYKKLIKKHDGDFRKIEKDITKKVEKYTEYSENYGLKALQQFQKKSKTATFVGPNGQWDLSQYNTTEEAITDVAEALKVSKGAAESFIALWRVRSTELKEDWDNLTGREQLDNLVNNLDNLDFISKDVFKSLADKLGLSLDETIKLFYDKVKKKGKTVEIPITPSLVDNDGNPKEPEEIQKDIASIFKDNSIEQPYLTRELKPGRIINKGLDAEAAVQQIQSWGYSLEDAITYVDESGIKLAKAIQTWNPKKNGGKGGFVEKIVQADSWDELQTKVQEELKASDYAQQASALAAGIAAPIGEAVGNAITKILEDNSQYNVDLTTDVTGFWSKIQSYLSAHPFTASVTSSVESGESDKKGKGSVSDAGALGGIVKSRAGGKSREISPGWALTGEEGPEIVWNKKGGYAYVTGQNGPEFQNLSPGDRIFNAPETRRIFKNTSFAKGGLYHAYGGDPPDPSDIWFKRKELELLKKQKKEVLGAGPKAAKSKDKEKSGKQSTWRNELDWLYDLMEDIAEYERKQTIIQAQYELYLKDINKKGSDLFKLTQKELVNLETQLKAQNLVQQKRLQEMKELQKQINNAGYGKYVKYNQKDQTIEINWDAIEKIQNKDTYDEVTEWLSRLEDVQGKMDDAEDAIQNIKSQLKELQERYLQQYLDFQTKVMDALVAQYQVTIDNLSELNDTLNDNNANILESIQKEIDLERQIRDNTDTEKELSDLEAQLAYLQRDTSNANEVEIRTLQKQLEESREDYSDTLIDQSIDRLQEANDAAAEQREKQIELMQAQLDYWQESGGLWGEVADLIAGGFTKEGSIIKGSDLWEVLKQADNWDALSESQKKNWANELILETNEVGAHLIQLSGGKAVSFQKVYDSIASANGKLTQEIKAAAETVRASIGSLKGKLGGTPGHSISATKGEGKGYASGGTATSTGLALLHGTPQEPEYVLNARQTDAFLRLADVLPAALGNVNTTSSSYSGNATFNVEVNVGSISNDYDVDRLVARIKENLYDAASYRNGNVLGFLR